MLYILGLLIVAAIAVTGWWIRASKSTGRVRHFTVEPVSEKWDWKTQEPFKARPFKPVYHMVMNIARVAPNDWLRIEKTYDDVTDAHARILSENVETTCKVSDGPSSAAAVRELYDIIFDVLVQRYPSMFIDDGKRIVNTVKNVTLPRCAADAPEWTSKQFLRAIMVNTEEDLQMLEFDPEQDEFVLRVVGGLTSDGFSWRSKLGQKLSNIHRPVPGYEAKLKTSMNRYFKKLQPGNIIERHTWGAHFGSPYDVYCPDRHNLSEKQKQGDMDWENEAFLRVERQLPLRLPKSGFLVLTQHTYMYSFADIKREGSGPALADSIEAWPEDMAEYKGVPNWGPVVCEYLRS